MKLLNVSYMKKGRMIGFFDKFPHSKVLFSRVKKYYFVSTVYWDERDQVVTRADLEKMELLLNNYFGTEAYYKNRKAMSD
ncbi:hypothetical protein JOC95_003384 [Bacillus tianshenii]|uniref:Uncharacterized protein n=1 Tax=Sutcliffiella tianshenii TaxID=1463404 RepID=A0ABS2P3J2_9BACI|nr:hypothetical protein [Bacillus tianshenii]MBM7621495.1 hypothetical protein [Bacillus tianshenii]